MSVDSVIGVVPLSWARSDPEHWFGLRSARFTRVSSLFAMVVGAALTVAFYCALIPFDQTYFVEMFTHRGPIPYCIVALSCWSLVILCLKRVKLGVQRRALAHVVVPADPDFVLSPATVDDVMTHIYQTVDDPKNFFLFNRIVIALSNLRNLGRVADVDEILRSQAANDEAVVESSYSMVHGFVWAIPVLGFIGTVLGLSQAIGGFGGVLATTSDVGALKPVLQQVTAGLAIAFETTLEGLVAALVIQLFLTALKKGEEEFLDSCSEYCIRHVVGRLRLMPYENREG